MESGRSRSFSLLPHLWSDERMAQMKDPFLSLLTKPVSFSELKAGISTYLK